MNGLVLNLGFKSVRAIIFDSDGKVISNSHEKVSSYINKDLFEQDPHEWWSKGLNCMKKVLEKERNINFITVTSSAACLVPVDDKGDPLCNAIMVSDKRSHKESKEISELESFRQLPHKSDPTLIIPKIMWIKKNSPEIFEKTHKFLSPNDFLINKMADIYVIDELNATKYFTMNNSYPSKLLESLGIDEKLLPKISPTGMNLNLSETFSREIQLNKNTPIILTTYDAICALFGV